MVTDRSMCAKVLNHILDNHRHLIRVRILVERPVVFVAVYLDLPGGKVIGTGEARCNAEDRFNAVIGCDIATVRALRNIADNPGYRKLVLDSAIQGGILKLWGERWTLI